MDLITASNQYIDNENNVLSASHEWTWDEKLSTSIKLSANNLHVTFNPVYSTGTAVVKGSKPLQQGKHHFWEISMIDQIHGTDIMVGVGTANADISEASQVFCALLGQDKESWGFSYKGYVQHDNKTCDYGLGFIKGSSVGVHLDTWRGTLQFFLDRKPLGVAFTNLNNVIVYPLISSTMAKCVMKLTCSYSIPVTLQTSCLAVLSSSQKAYLSRVVPALKYLSQSIFADVLQKDIDYDNEENIEFPMEIILDEFDYALVGFKKKRRN